MITMHLNFIFQHLTLTLAIVFKKGLPNAVKKIRFNGTTVNIRLKKL